VGQILAHRGIGSPREVFTARAPPFFRGFLRIPGDHNVIATDHGKIAVRADRYSYSLKTRPMPALRHRTRRPNNRAPTCRSSSLRPMLTTHATPMKPSFDAIAAQAGPAGAIDVSDNDIASISLGA